MFADIYQRQLSAGQVADKDGDDGPSAWGKHTGTLDRGETRQEALIGIPFGAQGALGLLLEVRLCSLEWGKSEEMHHTKCTLTRWQIDCVAQSQKKVVKRGIVNSRTWGCCSSSDFLVSLLTVKCCLWATLQPVINQQARTRRRDEAIPTFTLSAGKQCRSWRMSLLYRVSHLQRAQATQSSQLTGRCPPAFLSSRLLHTSSRTSRASTSPWPRVRSTNSRSLWKNGTNKELLDVLQFLLY